MSHLAGDRHHDLPGERRTARARPTDPNGKTAKVAILTPQELSRFLHVADRDFVPFFVLNAFTGLRREEVIRLDWSEIKLDRRNHQ
jgi:integrase